ncbi:MAG: NGG1p interacting factor NIF3 [Candidatus Moranbacteria bacterium]|nr:NGG1p interacting factor NIF3 [Candidatus Moranbacteria bacterium]
MNIQEIYKLGIKMGIEADFRSKKQIDHLLSRANEKFKNLSKEEKEYFDQERLTNPYPDTSIQFNNGIKNIKRVMVGIDIDPAELMIARYLSDQNPKKPVDLVICHHPIGKSLADLGEVMPMMVDLLHMRGIPVNVAEGILKERIDQVEKNLHANNHYQVVDAARLLNMSLMNVHTPADNLSAQFVEKEIEKRGPMYVNEVIKALLEIPEYKEYAKRSGGPKVFAGSESNRAGKIAATEFAGGTSYNAKMYQKLADAGIGTIISMHQSEENRKEAQASHINVIVAGHLASDSLGMNLFLDELEKKGIEIIPCGGFIRVSRVKNEKNKKK